MIVLPIQTYFFVPVDPRQAASDTPWRSTGWEVQPVQPPAQPLRKAAAMAATGLFLVLAPSAQDASDTPWLNTGWEVQPVQPPHRAPEVKSAAIARGDDGIEARFVQWFNVGEEVQPLQPPHPRSEKSGALAAGDSGIELPFISPVVTISWGFEQQPTARRMLRPITVLRTVQDDAFAPLINWLNTGWEVQPVQPPHPRPERSGAVALGDTGTQGPFVNWLNAGWEVQSVQPPFYPTIRQRYPGTKGKSEFLGFPAPVPMVWDTYFHIRQPKPNSSGAFVGGDTGIELPFVFTAVATPLWGWEFQQSPYAYRSKPGVLIGGDIGIEAPFVFTAVATPLWGWEFQHPPLPFKPNIYQRANGAGGESVFAAFQLDAFYEVQSWQPPHPRPERSGAILRGDEGNEGVFVFVSPVPILEGFDFQPLPARKTYKGATIARSDDGIQAQFINWYVDGWAIQPVQPPHPVPERRAGAVMRGDDGIEGGFVNWLVDGWAVQPVQPPHPASERRAGAILLGDTGIEGPFVNWYVDGWAVQHVQPPHPRPEKAASWMFGNAGNQAPFVFVAPPVFLFGFDSVQASTFYRRPTSAAMAGALFGGFDINAVFVFVPPPPPPIPGLVPIQFRKVFAVNCAQDNTNVAVTSLTSVFDPVIVGMTLELMASTGNYLPPNTPGQTMVITKPDGTVIRLSYPDAFIGTRDIMTDVGLFMGGTYLLGGVFLDQAGLWSVQVVKSPVDTALGTFFVQPS
jgi:hypothetical protein